MNNSTRVLMIDDDLEDQELFCEAASHLIYKVECEVASSGIEALRLLAQKKADVIFLDLYMPLIGGLELLKLIKENKQYKDIPVIMYTQSTVSEDLDRCLELGADAIFEKPICITTLEEGINQHLSELKRA